MRNACVHERRAVRAPELRRRAAAVQSGPRRWPVPVGLDHARVVRDDRPTGLRASALHAAGFLLPDAARLVRRDAELFVSSRQRLSGRRVLQHHQPR